MSKPRVSAPVTGISLPTSPKRGVKPSNIDQYINDAIAGRDAGQYATAEQAAYDIAKREHGLQSEYFDPLRCKLKRRLQDLFND
jgi:hypothetical protein